MKETVDVGIESFKSVVGTSMRTVFVFIESGDEEIGGTGCRF